MEYAPTVDWGLARRVARRAAGDLPDLSRAELEQLVASLRSTARRAGELAAEHLELDSVGAGDIRVVDWDGWGRGVRRMADSVVGDLDLPARPDGLGSRLRAIGNGTAAGLAIGKFSRHLLGQYDAFTGDDVLYLLAPTIVLHERMHGFVPAHFRLWVALHEQTHALQFRAADWLGPYLRERMRAIADDEARLVDSVVGLRETGDLAAMIVSRQGLGTLSELRAAMTFLEGHADWVADAVGARHASTVGRMRKVFSRPKREGWLARIVGSLDKESQYREGLAFCRSVARRRSRRFVARAFRAPENLPTMEEIANPAAWIRRVSGAA